MTLSQVHTQVPFSPAEDSTVIGVLAAAVPAEEFFPPGKDIDEDILVVDDILSGDSMVCCWTFLDDEPPPLSLTFGM